MRGRRLPSREHLDEVVRGHEAASRSEERQIGEEAQPSRGLRSYSPSYRGGRSAETVVMTTSIAAVGIIETRNSLNWSAPGRAPSAAPA